MSDKKSKQIANATLIPVCILGVVSFFALVPLVMEDMWTWFFISLSTLCVCGGLFGYLIHEV